MGRFEIQTLMALVIVGVVLMMAPIAQAAGVLLKAEAYHLVAGAVRGQR